MKRAAAGATEAKELVMIERALKLLMFKLEEMKRAAADATEPVMKRVRNGAMEPVMTEQEMERVMGRLMQEMEPVMQEMQEIKRVMEPMMQEMQEIKHLIESKQSSLADCNVQEQLEQVTERMILNVLKHFNLTPRTSPDQAETSEGRSYQLRFANKLPSNIFTDSKIEAEIGGPVRIELIDTADSEAPVTSGPLSSIKIQILVLDGDFDFDFENQKKWTEKFNSKVKDKREGKRPLVTGKLDITLRDGVGIISDIKITDNSSWTRCGEFRLGARVAQNIGGDVSIKEAISEAFAVKDHHGEGYQKKHPPSLGDEVWRLERIAKDGRYHKRLTDHKIVTVMDFMRMYITDPTKLKRMLRCKEGEWKKIVEHASTCDVNDEISFTCFVDGICLLFNSVYKLVAAAIFNGQNYQLADDPTFIHTPLVKSIKEHAYRNVSSFVSVDGPVSFGPSNPLISPQAEPISCSTSGLQHQQGSTAMQIDFNHATTLLHVEQDTHLPQGLESENGISEIDDWIYISSIFNGESDPNLGSEMTSHALAPTRSPVNATWEQNNGFNLPLTSNDSEFGRANTHGVQQAMSMPTDSTKLREMLDCPEGAWDTIVEHASTCDDLKNFEISKVLTESDIKSNPVLPTEIQDHMIPVMNGRDFLEVTAVDMWGHEWKLCYDTKGPFFTTGWSQYVDARGVQVKDELNFSGHQVAGANGELEMLYTINVTRPRHDSFNREPAHPDAEYL
ncbi:hypothetical protein EZV62_006519 [Acer yangbiense]|uniref:TF-B3 domain-containing protein n=1 Tax=Acer yangbiense TaxID=1000413 RepID=A0A5C7I7U8_9ROSI|nr:hypothetical protein EZV62_006519 [Acer yangbiense]